MPLARLFVAALLLAPAAALWAQAPQEASKDQSKETARGSASAGEISAPQLVGLPLNGRSYSQLATLQAGVSDSSAEQSSRGGGGGNLSASGSRITSNSFLLDGTNIMDTTNNLPRSAAGVQLGSDAVLQVLVFSANYTAEYGRDSGAVLNSITRSGTETFHGTLFEYFRNSKLDARNFFDPAQPPPFKRNQFGFALTGPLHKNKTFFMGSMEVLRDRLTQTLVNYFPDAQARQGIITDAAGNVTQVVPVAPAVKPYLALYPLPNSIRLGRGSAQNRAPLFLPTNETYFVLRLDHKISARDSIFGRYTLDRATSSSNQAAYLFTNLSRTQFQYLTLVESHVFHPQLLGAFRFGFTRPVSTTVPVSAIDIPSNLFFVPESGRFGQIFHAGLTPFGPTADYPSENRMATFQFAGDLWASKGAHALRFGAEIHRYRWHVSSDTDKGATWRFTSLESYLAAGAGGGTSMTVALPGSDNTKNYRQTLMGLYIQDSIALTRRLQLNAGLRYEPSTLLHDINGRTAFLTDPLHDSAMQIGPYLANNPSLRNLSPRLSLAWSPFGNPGTVLRAGFGIYYDQLLAYVVDSRKNSVPFHQEVVRTNFDSSPYFPDAVAAALVAPIDFNAQVMDYRNTKSPAVLRYNFALQQALAGWKLQASYVGARGNHLYRSYEVNLFPNPIRTADGTLFFPASEKPLNPAFGGGINVLGTDAQSFYNSLQLSAGKTFGPGISLQANYTYSKSVDDASTIGPAAFTPQSGQVPYALNRGLERALSDFDLRHRLTVSYFYTLPKNSGQRWFNSALLSTVLQDWRLGGIVLFRSGIPFTALMNVTEPGSLFSSSRPNLLPGHSNNPTHGVSAGCGGIPAGQKVGTPDLYFDPCAFSLPEPGTLGNLGRNTIISPSVVSMDLSLQKEFRLTASKQLQFRAEVFNLANHSNLNRVINGPVTVFTGFPARVNATAAIIQSTVTTARQIQFALRFSF